MTSAVSIQDRLGGIWEVLLEVGVRPEDDFFDLGGDSLLVVELVTRAREAGLDMKVADVFDNPILGDLAQAVSASAAANKEAEPRRANRLSTEEQWRSYISPWSAEAPSCLVPFLEDGMGDPLFVVHSGAGNIRFISEVSAWGAGRPVYGFEAPGYRGEVRPMTSVPELVEKYLSELRVRQPHGPYRLAGLCFGGVLALEMARCLRERNEEVALVALVNAPSMEPFIDRGWGMDEIYHYRLRAMHERFAVTESDDAQELFEAMLRHKWIEADMSPADVQRLQMLWSCLAFAQIHHEVRPYDGHVLMFQSPETADAIGRYWYPLLSNLEPHWIPGGADHLSAIAQSPAVAATLMNEMGFPAIE